jgi:hypothetical protein
MFKLPYMFIRKSKFFSAILLTVMTVFALTATSCNNNDAGDGKKAAAADSPAAKMDSTMVMKDSSNAKTDSTKAAMDTASTRPIKNPR